jgi:hypothetical protein
MRKHSKLLIVINMKGYMPSFLLTWPGSSFKVLDQDDIAQMVRPC